MNAYDVGYASVCINKSAETHDISYSLAGRLQLSQTGWLALTVPAALVRGAFDALHEEGVELPNHFSIPVMAPWELKTIGGGDKITERGHSFKYTLGPVRSHDPNRFGTSKVWFIQIFSPALKRLRYSYGLTPYIKKTHCFVLPIAVRKTGVITGEITKLSFDVNDYDLEAIEKAASGSLDIGEPKPSGRSFLGDVFSYDNLKHMSGHGSNVPKAKRPGWMGSVFSFLNNNPLDYPLRSRGLSNTANVLNYGSKAVVGLSAAIAAINSAKYMSRASGDVYRQAAETLGETDIEVLKRIQEQGSTPSGMWRLFKANALPAFMGGDPTPVGDAVRNTVKEQFVPWVRDQADIGVTKEPKVIFRTVDALRSLTPTGAAMTAAIHGMAKPQELTLEHSLNRALEGPLNQNFDLSKSTNFQNMLESLNEANKYVSEKNQSNYTPHPLTGVGELPVHPKRMIDGMLLADTAANQTGGGLATARAALLGGMKMNPESYDNLITNLRTIRSRGPESEETIRDYPYHQQASQDIVKQFLNKYPRVQEYEEVDGVRRFKPLESLASDYDKDLIGDGIWAKPSKIYVSGVDTEKLSPEQKAELRNALNDIAEKSTRRNFVESKEYYGRLNKEREQVKDLQGTVTNKNLISLLGSQLLSTLLGK